MSREILTKYRTKVIEDFIMIEGYLNSLISKDYLGEVSRKFLLEVLFDELFSFGLRVHILEKILNKSNVINKPKKLIEDLRRLSKIRNYFAHCNTAYYEGPLGSEQGGVPHPKKGDSFLDCAAIVDEHEQLIKAISEQLIKLMDSVGILFMHDADKGVLTILIDKDVHEMNQKQNQQARE